MAFPIVVFIVLIIVGLWTGELTLKATAVFLALWILGFVAAGYFTMGLGIFVAFTALLDFILILMIVRGDIPIR